MSKVSVAKFFIAFTLVSVPFLQIDAQTYPDTIRIPVTYYDFHSDGSNPEFEKAPTGAPTRFGMVADTLDGQRKPILGPTPYWNCQIAKWFRPWTPGDYSIPNYTNPATTTCSNPVSTVNYDTAFKNIVIHDSLPFVLQIVLQRGTAGIYQFQSSAFFPLDGRGFGAEVSQGTMRTHNYSFSMELHWQFTKVPGLTFQFEGDEDVWVFINNRLVMDIGGIHNTTAGSVNVDTLGLTDDKNYMFDFFYCERHVTGAAVRITVNIIAPPPTNLTYSTNPASYVVGTAITPNTPSSQGGAVASYSVSPALPAGLVLDTITGVITGTPTVAAAMANYMVTAITANGSDTVTLSIAITAALLKNLKYSANPTSYGQKFSIKACKNQIVFMIRPDLINNSKIKIQNLSGKLIADFQGSQRTIWNCKGYSAGLYIAQIYLKNALATSIPVVLNP